MGQFVADDTVVGLAQVGQRQGVGGGAIEDEEHLTLGLEQLTEAVGDLLCPAVIAVGEIVITIGLHHVRHRLGTDTGRVVTGQKA